MDNKELTKWAIKGLTAEIDEIEKSVNRGKQFLLQYERGQQPKTPKTPDEIKQIIRDKKAEIEKLDKMRFDLDWELAVENKE